MKSIDLFSIATSGVNASSKLLQTTSNNIANINTEGYVRERTTFANNALGGVGQSTTERVINVFAQNQLRRDITQVGELQAFSDKTTQLDNLLANEANSIAAGLSDFFASLQTAATDPTNLASRESVLARGESLLQRMGSISDFMSAKEEELNLEFTSELVRTNNLIKNIGELNKAIIVAKGSNPREEPSALLNERDKAINELAELMSIDVRESTNNNGAVMVNLSSGESLVMENGSFNVFELGSDADLDFKQLRLATSFNGDKQNTSINIKESELGGTLGGLFRFRDEVLGTVQRDMGQLALAFADAVNSQNKMGMDLDLQLGGNIFTLPTFQGLNYEGTPDNLPVTGRITEGAGNELTDADYKITVDAVDAAGLPTSVTVEMLNGDGTPKKDASGNNIAYNGLTVGAGFNELPGGIEIEFEAASGYSSGDEFLLQPTKNAASLIGTATDRPEDLAFASPIRVEPNQANLGDATVRSHVVTNTEVGAEASAFNGSGGIHSVAESPSATVGAPAQVLFTSASSFQVLDNASPPNVITNVTGVTDYNNLLAQAQANGSSPAWPAEFSALDDYPGYDFSLQGEPVAGDSFSVSYNTNGTSDNTNAVELAKLQQEALVQLSSNSANGERTLHDAYASLVGKVGEEAATADISLQAADAMRVQSQTWFDSVSGVNLDEEAANLVRYQQSYAAAARILSTAQEVFDTILSAAR
ncbi:flagellar hook-associated protein FlgK [Alteromonas pelagimontana]|nr:flagellar hook-associated protein FlgK [Alteromonas pelagimontana]